MAKKMVMAMMVDSSGLPRAWATGPAEKRDDVVRLAQCHIAAYVQEKQRLGELLEVTDFELKTSEVE